MSNFIPLPFEKPITDLAAQLEQLEKLPNPTAETRDAVRRMRLELQRITREIYDNLSPGEVVKVARHQNRPQTLDYLELICDEFVELHGDRAHGDDRAIISGFAKLEDQRVMFIGQHKGRSLDERMTHNYGMAHPEGYRKALLRMQMAAKYRLPVVCFIDTSGAYPGIGAEERGQAYQIALNLREMSQVSTPIVCVVIGEGGSGGALGIGIGDHVAVLQYAYYSVISPEGCAGILWKNGKFADQAAKALRFTARDLLEFGVIDEIIAEPLGGAHRDHRRAAALVKASVLQALKRLGRPPATELLERRYEKFRRMGVFEEVLHGAGEALESGTTPQDVNGASAPR